MSRLKITVTPELNENIKLLQEYYSEKTKAGAIVRAVKDCATVAEHKNVTVNGLLTDNDLVEIERCKFIT